MLYTLNLHNVNVICQPNWKKKIMPEVLQMLVISCLMSLLFSLFLPSFIPMAFIEGSYVSNTHLWNEQVQDTLMWGLNKHYAFSSAIENQLNILIGKVASSFSFSPSSKKYHL